MNRGGYETTMDDGGEVNTRRPSGRKAERLPRRLRRDFRRLPSTHSGFTVIEIVIALTILALILIPLFTGFTWSLGQTGMANKQTSATNLARERLEMARVAASTPAGFAALSAGGDPRAPVPGTPFDRELLVGFDNSLNIITLTVNVYPNSVVTAPLVSLSTVVSQ